MSGAAKPQDALGWGVISTAAILADLLPAFAESDQASLRAIASRDQERARALADAHDIPTAYGSYEELLADEAIDCVYIPLPNSLHGEWTRAAIEAGKHVLCEKPLTPSAEEAQSLFDLAESRGVVLMEAFMYRHHPKTKKLREVFESGEIGQPRVIRSKFHFKTAEPEHDIRYDPELAGGALRDVGSYCVSLASYLVGSAPDSLTATARMSESGIDEQFSATLGFGNDLLAVFDCGMNSPLDLGVEVLGTDGRITVPMPWYAHLEPLSIEVERNGEWTTIPTPGPNAYRLEIDNVCAAARGGTQPEISAEETVRNLTTIERLLEVAETSRSHAA
jgi:predicted dehydrogenase